MRFLADAGISPKTVEFLIGLGYEADHVRTLGLERSPDQVLVERANVNPSVEVPHRSGRNLQCGSSVKTATDYSPEAIPTMIHLPLCFLRVIRCLTDVVLRRARILGSESTDHVHSTVAVPEASRLMAAC